MKFLRSMLLSICLLGCGSATAGLFSDRNFDQEHMITTNYSVIILSAFEDDDHITAYSDYGSLLWDVTVNPKVISWKIKDGLLYVFSKSRFLEKTYLTCIDPATGYILWERP
jgi:outer membrane protein assembly factor BamB